MLKKFLIAIGGFILVVLTLGAVKAAQFKKQSSVQHVMPLSAVTTAEAAAVDWHPTLRTIGTLIPVEGVTLSADAEGTIVRIAAESGSAVKAGDLLVELDTSVEAAQLAAAESRANLAQINLERARDLWDRNAMAKSDFDTTEAAAKQITADVNALRAVIDKKRVRAPFDGRVGIRLVNAGQFVARGRALIPLQKLDPIFVNFSVPQRQLPDVSLGQKIAVGVDAFEAPFAGTISAINSEVDAASRNITVQATLANPQEKLRAGMFVQVEVELPSTGTQVVLPATAIAYAPYGNSVFIVENMKGEGGKEYLGVRQQIVKLGATRGDMVTITEGVKAGEQVVTGGVFKLRNGAPVQVNNSVQPTSNPAPKPANT